MKRLFVVAFVFAVLWAVNARADAEWTTGVKAGLSIATVGGDAVGEADDVESRTTFAGGFFAQANLSPHFGLRFEGLFVGKGARGNEGDIEGTLEFGYVELPMLLVGRAPVSQTITLSAFAGPTLGINVGADAEVAFGAFSIDQDISDQIADFEFGLAFGVGADFEVGSVVLVLDARYDMGLTSIDDGLSETGEDLDLQNRAWLIMAGVGFPIGR